MPVVATSNPNAMAGIIEARNLEEAGMFQMNTWAFQKAEKALRDITTKGPGSLIGKFYAKDKPRTACGRKIFRKEVNEAIHSKEQEKWKEEMKGRIDHYAGRSRHALGANHLVAYFNKHNWLGREPYMDKAAPPGLKRGKIFYSLIRSGANLAAHTHMVHGDHSTPYCLACSKPNSNQHVETAKHLVCYCSAYSNQRGNLLTELNITSSEFEK